jgi:thiol-disulfide isomerase/thioredoxin
MTERSTRDRLPVESRLPAFTGANGWLNTSPLTPEGLLGKVVAVQFWTFTCINWLRTLPYIRGWAQTYRDHGLVVVGVHTPEFGVEHDLDNVRRAMLELGIDYPVVIDNDYNVWNAFANRYWPALYIADADGRIRHHHFGEGGYEQTEKAIRQLLTDAGAAPLPELAPVLPRGIEAPADWDQLRSPETYVGLRRSEAFASPENSALDEPRTYSLPPRLGLNEWALAGSWTFHREDVVADAAGARLVHHFHARDVNLILTPPGQQHSARFRVTLDGRAPGPAHGLDVDEQGNGRVDEVRLYQLIRQPGDIADRQFEIEFLDPGAAALCFTFG